MIGQSVYLSALGRCYMSHVLTTIRDMISSSFSNLVTSTCLARDHQRILLVHDRPSATVIADVSTYLIRCMQDICSSRLFGITGSHADLCAGNLLHHTTPPQHPGHVTQTTRHIANTRDR